MCKPLWERGVREEEIWCSGRVDLGGVEGTAEDEDEGRGVDERPNLSWTRSRVGDEGRGGKPEA